MKHANFQQIFIKYYLIYNKFDNVKEIKDFYRIDFDKIFLIFLISIIYKNGIRNNKTLLNKLNNIHFFNITGSFAFNTPNVIYLS